MEVYSYGNGIKRAEIGADREVVIYPAYGKTGEWFGAELDRLRTHDSSPLPRFGWVVKTRNLGTGSAPRKQVFLTCEDRKRSLRVAILVGMAIDGLKVCGK